MSRQAAYIVYAAAIVGACTLGIWLLAGWWAAVQALLWLWIVIAAVAVFYEIWTDKQNNR